MPLSVSFRRVEKERAVSSGATALERTNGEKLALSDKRASRAVHARRSLRTSSGSTDPVLVGDCFRGVTQSPLWTDGLARCRTQALRTVSEGRPALPRITIQLDA